MCQREGQVGKREQGQLKKRDLSGDTQPARQMGAPGPPLPHVLVTTIHVSEIALPVSLQTHHMPDPLHNSLSSSFSLKLLCIVQLLCITQQPLPGPLGQETQIFWVPDPKHRPLPPMGSTSAFQSLPKPLLRPPPLAHASCGLSGPTLQACEPAGILDPTPRRGGMLRRSLSRQALERPLPTQRAPSCQPRAPRRVPLQSCSLRFCHPFSRSSVLFSFPSETWGKDRGIDSVNRSREGL